MDVQLETAINGTDVDDSAVQFAAEQLQEQQAADDLELDDDNHHHHDDDDADATAVSTATTTTTTTTTTTMMMGSVAVRVDPPAGVLPARVLPARVLPARALRAWRLLLLWPGVLARTPTSSGGWSSLAQRS
jgi:hypothetical protein